MAGFYLDFEKPIADLDQKIDEMIEMSSKNGTDLSSEIVRLKEKREKITKKIYSNLSRWQRVQLARYPKRPYTLDYIERLSPSFVELHGDRCFADDRAIVSGIGKFDDFYVAYVGQQKGKNTKENLERNFGMSRPEGYRKALRIMKMAAKFNRPVISFIDTPGPTQVSVLRSGVRRKLLRKILWRWLFFRSPLWSLLLGRVQAVVHWG